MKTILYPYILSKIDKDATVSNFLNKKHYFVQSIFFVKQNLCRSIFDNKFGQKHSITTTYYIVNKTQILIKSIKDYEIHFECILITNNEDQL